jgi:hypothetical protein
MCETRNYCVAGTKFRGRSPKPTEPRRETEVTANSFTCFYKVVSVLATGPTGHSVAGSNPTEDGGFLRVIKIPSTHFLRRASKAVGPMS